MEYCVGVFKPVTSALGTDLACSHDDRSWGGILTSGLKKRVDTEI